MVTLMAVELKNHRVEGRVIKLLISNYIFHFSLTLICFFLLEHYTTNSKDTARHCFSSNVTAVILQGSSHVSSALTFDPGSSEQNKRCSTPVNVH